MEAELIVLDGFAIEERLDSLTDILVLNVAAGAAISFMAPLSDHDACQFWMQTVRPEVEAGKRLLFGVTRDNDLLGSVQLLTDMAPNQGHRAEIVKMIVHPSAQRQGLGRLLMTAALDHARAIGKSLITLDTRTGDVGEHLYGSVGFEVAGVIPDYAWDPDGQTRHAATYMFLRI